MSLRLFIAALLTCISLRGSAQALVYTNESDFSAALLSISAFTNNFTNLGYVGQLIHPLRAGGTNAGYVITTLPQLELMVYDGNISTVETNTVINISCVSSNITALGGLFYCVDTNDAQVDGTLGLTLSDGTSTNVDAPAAEPPQFIGFISSGPLITSLAVSNVSGSGYPALTHFYAVPDPPPSISVSSASTAIISWPAIPTAYILESSPALTGSGWSNSVANFQQSSNRVQASVPISSGAAFFRLKHP